MVVKIKIPINLKGERNKIKNKKNKKANSHLLINRFIGVCVRTNMLLEELLTLLSHKKKNLDLISEVVHLRNNLVS